MSIPGRHFKMNSHKIRAQQIVETLLLFAVVIGTLIFFIGPSGPFRPAVRQVVNRVIDEIYYEYYWYTGPWEPCSVPCGGGTRSRTVYCADGNNNPVADSYCLNNPEVGPRPVNSEACNTFPCAVNGLWCPWSPWTDCTLPCGGGTQYHTRECACPPPAEGGLPCDGPDIAYQECNTQPCCTIRWVQVPINPCPPCGLPWLQGTYQVICQEQCVGSPPTVRPDADCLAVGAGPKPAEIVTCSINYCYLWYVSGWSTCSAPCGPATESRTVYCYYFSNPGVPVADSLCINEDPRNPRPRPIDTRSCYVRECACGLKDSDSDWCPGAETPPIPVALNGTVTYINPTVACSAAISDCEARCHPSFYATGSGCVCDVTPSQPYFDGIDNDCDGRIDEPAEPGVQCRPWAVGLGCSGTMVQEICDDCDQSDCQDGCERWAANGQCCTRVRHGGHNRCWIFDGDPISQDNRSGAECLAYYD